MNRVIWWPSGVFENKSHLKVVIFLSFHEQGRILKSLYTCISQPSNKISHLYYLFVFARYLLEITPLKLDIRKLGTKHERKQRNIMIADWWRNTFNTEERTASSCWRNILDICSSNNGASLKIPIHFHLPLKGGEVSKCDPEKRKYQQNLSAS